MLKPTENPAYLTPAVQSVRDLRGTWWLAHTKARFEKAFAWDMLRHEIGYFLPMLEKTSFSGGRWRHVKLPLFTSYVFVCGTDSDRHTAVKTNRLCQMIEVADQHRLIEELTQIESALLSKALVDQYPQLPVGRRCTIISGPLRGTEGLVVERRCGKARLVLEVTILSQGVVVEVDANSVQPKDHS